MNRVLSPYVRKKLREYAQDLLRRVRRVTCPTCGATRGQWCVQYGKKRTWCHRTRYKEAKFVGLVKGLRVSDRQHPELWDAQKKRLAELRDGR